jgi:glutamate racemase
MKDLPIAIIDSGVGGLSVARSLKQKLPQESIYYFADTAHFPYGLKSPELIKKLTLDFAQNAVKVSQCKALVIACHTMSAICMRELEQKVDCLVIGMIEPTITGMQSFAQNNTIKAMGLIATRATVLSGVYRETFSSFLGNKPLLLEQGLQALVGLVEEGASAQDMNLLLGALLKPDILNVDALVLACTHFFALKPHLKKIFGKDCQILDAADFVSTRLCMELEARQLLLPKNNASFFKVVINDNHERFLQASKSLIDHEFTLSYQKNA